MKRIYTLSAVLAFVFFSFSFVFKGTIKGSFNINNAKDQTQVEFYKKSIEAADLEGYRLRDERVKIKFQNGFELEFLSANELLRLGIAVNVNEYQTKFADDFIMPSFNILPSGHLTAGITTTSKK